MSDSTVPQPLGVAHVLCQDIPKPTMAKAHLPEQDGREKYGRVLRRASAIANLNRRQTADELGVDEAQLGRWWSGLENPQVWRYHAHPFLNDCLLLAQGEANPAVEVQTTLILRRRA